MPNTLTHYSPYVIYIMLRLVSLLGRRSRRRHPIKKRLKALRIRHPLLHVCPTRLLEHCSIQFREYPSKGIPLRRTCEQERCYVKHAPDLGDLMKVNTMTKLPDDLLSDSAKGCDMLKYTKADDSKPYKTLQWHWPCRDRSHDYDDHMKASQLQS